MGKKNLCILCDEPFGNEFRREAAAKGLSQEAFFRNIFFYWKDTSESWAKLSKDLISGERKIVDCKDKQADDH